jgi:hypothetical protein
MTTGSAPRTPLQLLLQRIEIGPGALQQRPRRAALLVQQRLQKVRRRNLVVVLAQARDWASASAFCSWLCQLSILIVNSPEHRLTCRYRWRAGLSPPALMSL